MADRYRQRTKRHEIIRTRCTQWIRKNKPRVYMAIQRQALEEYPQMASETQTAVARSR